jgi:hypothetical protein
MPKLRLDLQIPDSATMLDVVDALVKSQRELEWLLNGTLDEVNIKRMSFREGVVTGDITFEGEVSIKGGTALGAVSLSDSTAADVITLRDDYNQLLNILRNNNILNG